MHVSNIQHDMLNHMVSSFILQYAIIISLEAYPSLILILRREIMLSIRMSVE